ncbi:MAG TPA: DNA recombination protein RmuC [Candidatus Ventrousia excrementavium]|uniref:DNA recombination protein RmuC n=1 Tax=Candidatus Ventrousia excrementavium TaxID=2840961 RepID=A0A9D1LLV0_9CLOT|nr:DNA recombination protein RmuC [Candidatus Ventrousia excrementavium]
MEWVFACIVLAVLFLIGVLVMLKKVSGLEQKIRESAIPQAQIDEIRQDTIALKARQDMMIQSTENALDKLGQSVESSMKHLTQQMLSSNMQSEQKLDNLRRTLSESMTRMQEGNRAQLDDIRKTVDEKLQSTLEKKLNDSFQMVSERLEQVYKGLGEMQSLAAGVGDLKKVLSNVKSRGVLGEIQLGAILEQILSPEQYAKNVATKKGSQNVVEYAVKLPGEDGVPVWLPIDAKFPADAYEQLLDAYDSADPVQVEAALKLLRERIRGFARDIHSKYISPPSTTDFAIMFLPVEGLYAEVVRAGMIEQLQRDYKVNIAGPTTMGALLNSLQMGFRTLAIQKRSSEVWKVLSSVKTEFDTFGAVLEATQKRLEQAGSELDKLVGVRTRQIQNKLRSVQTLPEEQQSMLEE